LKTNGIQSFAWSVGKGKNATKIYSDLMLYIYDHRHRESTLA